MASPKTGTTAPASTAPVSASTATDEGLDDFVKLSVTRRFFKPAVCKDKDGNHYALRGHLMRTEVITSPQYGPTPVLIVRLTKPTMVCDDEDKLIQAEIGDDAMIVAGDKLEKLMRFADDPNVVGEVYIKPLRLEKLKNGHTMWVYDVRMGKLPRPRHEVEAELIAGFSAPLLDAAEKAASAAS